MSNGNTLTMDSSVKLPFPAAGVAWYTTILLAFLYWLSILDRFIISLLVEPIKLDLGISDMQFGLLHGAAFAVAFSFFGLIAGSLADRLNRRKVIFACVAIWSLATTACGLAHSFWQLLLARVGVGAGEAGLNPCATSMITDLFPRERLTTALAVYAIGASVGSGCAYLLGGVIVTMVMQADTIIFPVLGEIASWQAVFFIVGIPGVLISFLVFTTPEPARRGTREEKKDRSFLGNLLSGYLDLFKFMRSKGKFFIFHYAGFGVASTIATGTGVWYPAHMGRAFGWSASQIGLGLGVTLVFSTIAGKLICGYFVDAMYRRGYRDAQFRWYAGALLAAVPCGVIATTSDSPWVFLGGIGAFLALISPLPAVASAALNLVTPNEHRGAGFAFFGSTAGLIGLSLGPILVAGASDYIYGGNAIGYGIATMVAICCPIAAALLICGCKAMQEAVTEAEKWE